MEVANLRSRINFKSHAAKKDRFFRYDGESRDVVTASCKESFNILRETTMDPRSKELCDSSSKACLLFLDKFFDKILTCGPDYQSLHDAIKSRAEDLDSMRSAINSTGCKAEFFVVPKGSQDGLEPARIKYVAQGAALLTLVEDEAGNDEVYEIYTIHRDPKWMAPLFRAMLQILGHMNVAKIEEDSTLQKEIQSIALMIQSWAGIYTSFRSSREMSVRQERKIHSALANTETTLNWETRRLFEKVAEDIKSGRKPYVRNFSRALKSRRFQEFLNSDYSEQDYYFSGKATPYRGSNDENLRISAISSTDEVDPFAGCPFDVKVGYISGYNKDVWSGRDPTNVLTISIPQNKIKRRVIHIACNAIQDRCHYIHRRLMLLLELLPEDCTHDQREGINRLVLWTNPDVRKRADNPSIYCLDFSNATDLLNQEFQKMCLALVFSEEIVQFWDDISKLDKKFIFSDGKSESYTQSTGQPQGLLGSFCAFALAHHMLMLMTMKASGLSGQKSEDFYRVLGDDSVIHTIEADPGNRVLNHYTSLCEGAGLEFNVGKGHLTYHESEVADAEFAKVRVMDGNITTPVPYRLLSRVAPEKGVYHRLATMLWMAENEYPQIVSIVPRLLREHYGEGEQFKAATALIQSGYIPGFEKLTAKDQVLDEDYVGQIAFCYLVCKVKGSVIANVLKDDLLDASFDAGKSLEEQPLFLLKDDQILTYLDRVGSDHKIYSLIERNFKISDAIRSILGLVGINSNQIIEGLLQPTDEEIMLFSELDDQIRSLKSGIGLTRWTKDVYDRLFRSTRKLDRFSARSFIKRRIHDLSFIDDAISLHSVVFG